MIKIDESQFLGKGQWRSCYRHPTNSRRCVKVFHGEFDRVNFIRELGQNRRVAKKPHDLIIPNYYGEVETNLGMGYVFDLIQNERGEVVTLEKWLWSNPEKVEVMKESLVAELWKSEGVFDDLSCRNILAVENGGHLRFAIVDGLVEKKVFKFRTYLRYFARKKLKKKWLHFCERVDTLMEEINQSV